MFSKQTCFVLGAGASVPYGFPLGADLIKIILQDMEDEIYFYCNEKQSQQFGSKEAAGFEWLKSSVQLQGNQLAQISSSLRNYGLQGFDQRNPWKGMRFDSDECFYFYEKIKMIPTFQDLHDALIYFSPISIDAFLRDNPSYIEAGKIMISYSLLKRENEELFERGNHDNWYSYFLNDISSSCADDPKKLLENTSQLSIVTFNYDCSLDYWLQTWLKNTEIFNDDSHGVADQFLKEFNIDHVYGSLNNPNRMGYQYGQYCSASYFDDEQVRGLNFNRFIQAINLSQNIKVMYKDRRDESEFEKQRQCLYKKLNQAQEIIFIGFGFDRDNLDQLGLPRTENEWLKFCESKTIRWLNFENSMTGLSKQFNKIDKILAGKGSIIESTAKNICNAYQNDFKIFLF